MNGASGCSARPGRSRRRRRIDNMAKETTNPGGKPDWALTRRERKAKARAEAGLPPKKRRWWIVALVVVIVAGAAGWWYQTGGKAVVEEQIAAYQTQQDEAAAQAEAEAQAARDAKAAEVPVMQLTPSELLEIAPRRLRETVKVTGSLAPRQQLHLSAEVSARVDTVAVRAGDTVDEGQLLVQLDVETLSNQLEQQRASAEATRAQLKLARNQLERTQSLVDRGLSPPTELEAGQANVEQLEASLAAQEKQVENAERSLDHARVEAPFAGAIAERSVDPGSYVATGSPLLTLVDLSSLEFEATVPVSYAPAIEKDQPVELTVEGVRDREFRGRVERISPVAIQGSRMLPVYVGIDNPGGVLRGGMFASGQLILEQKDEAIGIPAQAVREDKEGRFVLVRDGDHVRRRAVEIARDWDGGRMVEIAEGLEPGDVIVAEPLSQLRAGYEISIVEE
ncbi:efflux RND transporter periplasmic adaptor subunit [Aquicoccus sp. SCR17]|nr:efflux RND transporter periplasmic adaptor subunit [Carideicomes alvinocaridis]